MSSAAARGPGVHAMIPLAIVAGHGDFAAGVISAVEHITGYGARLVPMSIQGLGPADIERTMTTLVEESGVHVIFTDLPAGSCTIAAGRVARAKGAMIVVTGVSLPVLLSFVMHDEVPPMDAARQAIERARSALRVVGGPARGD
jgi:PTS system N-acetylgalactosamine-specific IIA component